MIKIERCYCGAMPTMYEGKMADCDSVQIKCDPCGNHGALLLYTKPSDRQRMLVAACDGWYMGVRSNSRWHINNEEEA